jgi:hypothetical protein
MERSPYRRCREIDNRDACTRFPDDEDGADDLPQIALMPQA